MASRSEILDNLKETINEIGRDKFLETMKNPSFSVIYMMTQDRDLRSFISGIEDKIDDLDIEICVILGNIMNANYRQALITDRDARNAMALYHEEQHNSLKDAISRRKMAMEQRNLLLESAKKDYESMMFNNTIQIQ